MHLLIRTLLLTVCCLALLSSCREDLAPGSGSPETAFPDPFPAAGPTLKEAALFPVGNAWSAGHPTWGNRKGTDLGGPSDDFTGTAFGPLSTAVEKQLELPLEDQILAAEFNSVTPEVALKPHNVAVTPDSFDFAEADAMVEFAEANGLRIHGHVLLFDSSVPVWAREYEAAGIWTEQQWEDWLQNYIETVVGRYRGKMASWDVLNEIGKIFGGGLKTTDYFWYRVIGPDFMEKAFRWTEAADPDALLFINDFALGLFPGKLNDILRLADDLRAAGCKVDGIGFQGHIVLPFIQGDYGHYKRAFHRAAEAGYLVHLSELDFCVNLFGQTQSIDDLQQRLLRKRYNDIARAYRDGVPADRQWGITVWNISDRNSFYNVIQIWLDLQIFGGQDYPLLWDDEYRIKPSYYGFRNGLEGIFESWVSPPLYEDGRTERSVFSDKEIEVLAGIDRKALIEWMGIEPIEADLLVREAIRNFYRDAPFE